jgi:hypothetical protein
MEDVTRRLARVAAWATLLQLATILAYAAVSAVVGPRVESAEAFFELQRQSTLLALLRVDLVLALLVGLYLLVVPALLLALWPVAPATTLFASIATLVAVVLAFAGEPTFALLHLARQHALAGGPEQARLVAAARAVLAMGWWNGSGSYVTGFLLQGAGVAFSVVMLRGRSFSRVTAWSGLVGNAFDLAQHLLHPFVPGVASMLAPFMAAYLVWYLALARDLFRLARSPAGVPPRPAPPHSTGA